MNALEALTKDLQRPAGGWTFGAVTIFGALAAATLSIWYWWTIIPAVVLFIAHVMWGAHGYYPNHVS